MMCGAAAHLCKLFLYTNIVETLKTYITEKKRNKNNILMCVCVCMCLFILVLCVYPFYVRIRENISCACKQMEQYYFMRLFNDAAASSLSVSSEQIWAVFYLLSIEIVFLFVRFIVVCMYRIFFLAHMQRIGYQLHIIQNQINLAYSHHPHTKMH